MEFLLQDMYYQVYCPPGRVQCGDECEESPLFIPGSCIMAVYAIKLLIPTSVMAVENFTPMVRRRIEAIGITVLSQALGFEELGCSLCLENLGVDEKSQTFYMYNEIATYKTCDIETLRDHMVSFIDTSVELDSDLHIAFLFTAFTRDDRHSFYNRNLTSVGVIAKVCYCRATNRFVSEKLCPRLELPYSVMRSLPHNKAREEFFSLLRKKKKTRKG